MKLRAMLFAPTALAGLGAQVFLSGADPAAFARRNAPSVPVEIEQSAASTREPLAPISPVPAKVTLANRLKRLPDRLKRLPGRVLRLFRRAG